MSYYNDLADDLIETMDQEGGAKELNYHVLDHGYVKYVDHLGCDRDIVHAARISYGSPSDPVKDKQLLMRLYRDMHTSPFEMGKITFNIKLPIFVMRQFVRHRMQNLNEASARYKELPAEFYIPECWRVQDKQNKQHTVPAEVTLKQPFKIWDVDGSSYSSNDPSRVVEQHCQRAYDLYKLMLESGVGREMARMVIPLNIYTEIICCMDMKNMLGFFRQRLDPHAQLEIQAFAVAMFKIACELFPWTMDAFMRFKHVIIDQEDRALQYPN